VAGGRRDAAKRRPRQGHDVRADAAADVVTCGKPPDIEL
jgi:hypothetical protein